MQRRAMHHHRSRPTAISWCDRPCGRTKRSCRIRALKGSARVSCGLFFWLAATISAPYLDAAWRHIWDRRPPPCSSHSIWPRIRGRHVLRRDPICSCLWVPQSPSLAQPTVDRTANGGRGRRCQLHPMANRRFSLLRHRRPVATGANHPQLPEAQDLFTTPCCHAVDPLQRAQILSPDQLLWKVLLHLRHCRTLGTSQAGRTHGSSFAGDFVM